MRRGFTLVEVLVALLILSFAIGISLLSLSRLLAIVGRNSRLLDLSEVLVNKCEEFLNLSVSRITEGATTIDYKGRTYTLIVTKEVFLPRAHFFPPTTGARNVVVNNVTKVILTVRDHENNSISAEIVPRQ